MYLYQAALNQDCTPVLVKEKTLSSEQIVLKLPEQVVSFCREILRLDSFAEEFMYLIAVNTKLHILGVFEISHGTVDSALVTPREIFIRLA